MGNGSSNVILEPPAVSIMVDATFPGPASTSVPSRTAMLDERQIFITITVTTGPAATISSLSSSLIAAQATISLLANEVQQLQLASVSAVASVQSAAAASAFSVVASVSSSAALALASASTLVANADAAAAEANRSADAAIANASSIQVSDLQSAIFRYQSSIRTNGLQAQANLTHELDANRFTETQLAIAIVVSIIGTLALSLIGFLCFASYRDRRDQQRRRQLKELILRPDTANSSGSGDIMWDEAYDRRPPRRQSRTPQRSRSMVQTAPPRGPPRMPIPRPPETIREEREPGERPMSSGSNSTGPIFSLFPRVAPENGREVQSPRRTVPPTSPLSFDEEVI